MNIFNPLETEESAKTPAEVYRWSFFHILNKNSQEQVKFILANLLKEPVPPAVKQFVEIVSNHAELILRKREAKLNKN